MLVPSLKKVHISRHLVGVCAFLILCSTGVGAQQTSVYPPFTMTIRTTAYDARGEAISESTATRYDSATGDWRYVWNNAGYETSTLRRRGRGIYKSDARTQLTLKISAHAPGCPRRTAEQLRNDKNFVRTERVLGFEAYFLSQRFPGLDYLMETSFVPELGGGKPFKRVYTYDDGRKIIEEPTSVKLGEPAENDLRGPDYPVIEELPVFDKELKSKVLSQPDPIFPPERDTGGFGDTVYISVVIDETGRVLTADANTPITFLRDPAIAAAYLASFSPAICNGRPVKGTGLLRYKFVSPQLAKK